MRGGLGVPVLRVSADHPSGGAGRRSGVGHGLALSQPHTALNRLLLIHLGWSAAILAAAGLAIGAELAAPCPTGGWLAIDCIPARDPVLALIGLSAILYVLLLSAVVAWSARLDRLPGADPRGGRDWYLVAALVGVPIAPMLAFTILGGLGWLG